MSPREGSLSLGVISVSKEALSQAQVPVDSDPGRAEQAETILLVCTGGGGVLGLS